MAAASHKCFYARVCDVVLVAPLKVQLVEHRAAARKVTQDFVVDLQRSKEKTPKVNALNASLGKECLQLCASTAHLWTLKQIEHSEIPTVFSHVAKPLVPNIRTLLQVQFLQTRTITSDAPQRLGPNLKHSLQVDVSQIVTILRQCDKSARSEIALGTVCEEHEPL